MVSEEPKDKTVCVIGLGYVGQPLAEAFSSHLKTIGFDINQNKVDLINSSNGRKFECTSDPSSIKQADFILICVPTPITAHNEPDLYPVRSAAEVAGKNLKEGAIVVLESTVYPGVTEEVVVPILERESGMKCGTHFKVGYSPERINPGDEEHSIDKITKIVSGMDEDSTRLLAELYGLITHVYIARDIKTAEAAKVIENIQRDLNIALMNELSLIFYRMGLNTRDVLEAAGTKWNFHNYTPGLVGGHCIPVDPYYLVCKARELGYHSQVILAGRAVNDSMPQHVAEMAFKGLNDAQKVINGSKVIIVGLTYKENVPDIRESPARGIVKVLKEYKVDVYGYDPLLSKSVIEGFGVKALQELTEIKADCLILAVPHEPLKNGGFECLVEAMKNCPVIVDVKGIFPSSSRYNRYRL
ncbi:MAG: nucleotide sugar dehydrogenase [Candidatus Pacebacteria bacterium]|nr:nucleotide sugar dehydrogenase [Candidatus Paceibacterota bacterium]